MTCAEATVEKSSKLRFFFRPAIVMAVTRAAKMPAPANANPANRMSGQMSRPVPSQLSSTMPNLSFENDPESGSWAVALPPKYEESYLV